MKELKLKRVYLPAAVTDGYRILVDRLWPRGLKKEEAAIDLWDKQLAPSTELRKWFAHVPDRFPVFARRYAAELRGNAALAGLAAELGRHEVVTLLFSARDEQHNNAVVLAQVLHDVLAK